MNLKLSDSELQAIGYYKSIGCDACIKNIIDRKKVTQYADGGSVGNIQRVRNSPMQFDSNNAKQVFTLKTGEPVLQVKSTNGKDYNVIRRGDGSYDFFDSKAYVSNETPSVAPLGSFLQTVTPKYESIPNGVLKSTLGIASGVDNYRDLSNSLNNFNQNPSLASTANLAYNTVISLPVLGGLEKVGMKTVPLLSRIINAGSRVFGDELLENTVDYGMDTAVDILGKDSAIKYADGGSIGDPTTPTDPLEQHPRDWLTNWYKNRKLQDQTAQSNLQNEVKTRIANVQNTPMRKDIDSYMNNGNSKGVNLAGDAIAQYNPKDKNIWYNSVVDEYDIGTHELTHASDDIIGSKVNESDKNIIQSNLKPIGSFDKEYYSKLYDNKDADIAELSRKIENKAKALKNKEDLSGDVYDDGEVTIDMFYEDAIDTLSATDKELWSNVASTIKKRDKNYVIDLMMPKEMDGVELSIKNNYLKDAFVTKGEYLNEAARNHENIKSYYNSYISDPKEAHARLMDIRRNLDLKPDQIVTEKDIENAKKDGSINIDAYKELIKVAKDGDKSIIEMLNKVSDVAPIKPTDILAKYRKNKIGIV